MPRSLRHLILVSAVMATTVACSKKPAEPTPTATKQAPALPPAAAKAAEDVANDGKLDPNDPRHGTRKLIGLDTPVFVDGVQVAVFRYGELPVIPTIELEGGAKRWRVADYLEGIGLDLKAIRSVHFHGNADKIGSIEGSELRKEPDRFQFQFLSGDTGVPIGRWDTDGLKNEYNVHEIRRMTIYVKKPSPKIHPERQCHVGADGDCTDAIPYADPRQIAKGTRVYLDGKMVGFVKRRNVTDDMRIGPAAADPSESKYSVAKLLASMGVDPSTIKSVELMAGDDMIACATGEQFQTLAQSTYFTLPQHNHGKVRVRVPAELQAQTPGVSNKDALVSAILLYKNVTPKKHKLVAISEETDLSVQLAAFDDARGRLGRTGEQ
jgi:hypothetical protein